MQKFLLPDPEMFQSNVKDRPPLLNFYDWVVRQALPASGIILATDGEVTLADLKRMGKVMEVRHVIVHEDYDEKLRKITKTYLKRKYKCTAKRADKEIAFHFLDIGPSTKEIEGMDKKYVYLEEGFLRSDNE